MNELRNNMSYSYLLNLYLPSLKIPSPKLYNIIKRLCERVGVHKNLTKSLDFMRLLILIEIYRANKLRK